MLIELRSLQEERKKAREEKAKQLAEEEATEGGAANANVAAVSGQPDKLMTAAPVIVGTKGSFQEVLARRQAELAALKSKNAGGAANRSDFHQLSTLVRCITCH